MPTRKDKTNVAPIYREQVFIPASGATLMKQQSRPKVAGRPVSSGTVEIVSPEFDLLTGVRGVYNIASTPINITSKNAIKITDKQWDKAYIKAVKNNDLNEAQRLRDLHFQAKASDNVVTKDGVPIHNYHGTDTDFNIFDLSYFGKTDAGDRGRGFYFSSNKDIAENYGGIVKDVYLYGKTPYSGTRSSLLNRGRSKAEIITQYNKNFNKNINNDIKFLLEQQKSGDVSLLYKRLNIDKTTTPEQIKNKVIDYYSKRRDNFVKELGNIDEADIYLSNYENVIYDANKIKSAKAIIYDENGELINLSKRDNFNVNDIRMKCGGRRKAQLGLDIREGGIAIPIAPNMYYMNGRSHDEGGIGIGPNNKNGLEVEGGEVVQLIDSNHPSVGRQFKAGGQQQTMRVFSSVPLLRGVSPAQLVLQGYNPDDVFKAQEEFKDRNRINDDGTRYENGGNKIINYENLPSSFKGKRVNGRILQGGVPPVLSRGEFAMGNPLQRMSMWSDDLGEFSKYMARHIHKFIPKKVDKVYRHIVEYLSDKGPNNAIDNNAENLTKAISLFNAHEYKTGGIYIKPSKRGTFTAAAKKRGMGVQEFASKVLANKEDYSSAIVKKANFARNASRWKKELGGDDTKTAVLKRLRNKFTVAGDYGGGMFGGAGAGSVIMEQPKYVNDTITKRYLVPVTQTFNDAFRNARNSGQNEFMFDGKLYNTNLGDNPNNNTAGASRISTIIIPIEHKEVRRRKKEYGGNMIYTINGNVKNGLMSARPKAVLGKQRKVEGYGNTIVVGDDTFMLNEDGVYVPVRAGMEKIKSPSSTGGRTQSSDGRWIGQYKSTNIGDWIGLGSNLAGTVASYFMTKNAINKMPDPVKPVMAQAAKLKTRYNVEPQLTSIREAEQMNRGAVRRNTQSSNTSLAREQRLMNEARGAKNQLYGQKENIETQLINQDRLNRQSVMRNNVRNYNEYLNRLTATRQGQNKLRISNINNLLSGLTGSVNNILGTIESRRATNNTLRAIAAANPNVDARLIGGFDYYIDPVTKRKYNKNQQYVGTING